MNFCHSLETSLQYELTVEQCNLIHHRGILGSVAVVIPATTTVSMVTVLDG